MKLVSNLRLSGLSSLLTQSIVFSCSLIAISFVAAPARASNLVQNGSFETTTLSSPGGYFCSSDGAGGCISNVANWTSICRNGSCGNGSSPTSLLFANTNGSAFNGGIGLYSASNSPDGGNYVAADGDPQYNSIISQTISGLTKGASYQLTFYEAAAQQNGAQGSFTDQFQVKLGGASQLSDIVSAPQGGFSGWKKRTLNFVADGPTDVLSFLALGTPTNGPPVALLDGVSLVATPEASTSLLTFTALLFMVSVYAVRRYRSSKRA